ncbi:MAG: four helix bundle protein [Clostridia bacterium]|nr:four helix bundle protein [Clostridia bacterium]
MSQNIIENKSFEFAIRIVNLYKFLVKEKEERILSRQLLKSGTSIGANVSEAQRGQTMPDFVSKMSIALKEANETFYWIKLLYHTDYITKEQFDSISKDIDEIISILTAICKTSREKID